MQDELTSLLENAKQAVADASNTSAIEQLRVKYLGKKGELTELLKGVGQMPPAERPKLGKAINVAKRELHELLSEQEVALRNKALMQQLETERVDITQPGRDLGYGSHHPVARATQRCVDIFTTLGFAVAEGPEIEDEYYNFSALNFTEHHPAKDELDTFYFSNGKLLRTHTSPVQIRVMEKQKPPLRIITPGRVYRRDSDQTHTPMFHQLEGLAIAKECTFADLKGLLKQFFECFFETDIQLRFRPSYFPFTEPSAEVDLKIGERANWLEVMGCGMVHPNVLRNVNIDPDEFSGFAFGLGLDRMAMLRYQIPDLRMMFENDIRLLEQF